MSNNEKKKKKKKGSTSGVHNMSLDVTGTAMSTDYTGITPAPADTEDKRESIDRMIKR